MPLVDFVFVILFGLSVNSYNATQAGRPVENLQDVKVAVEKTIDDVKARDHFESFALNE